MQGFSGFLSFVSMGALADFVSEDFRTMTFYGSVAWVALLLLITVWVGYSFSVESFRVLWPLKVLRTTARLSTTALFIPLTSMLLSVYACPTDEYWRQTDLKCWETGHTIIAMFLSILIILFCCFSCLVVAVFFERDPTSGNILSKSHGRVDLIMLVVKVLLTLLYSQMGQIPSFLLILSAICGGGLWFFLSVVYLPYHSLFVNNLSCMMAALFSWAGIAVGLAYIRDAPEVSFAAILLMPRRLISASSTEQRRRLCVPHGSSFRSVFWVLSGQFEIFPFR